MANHQDRNSRMVTLREAINTGQSVLDQEQQLRYPPSHPVPKARAKRQAAKSERGGQAAKVIPVPAVRRSRRRGDVEQDVEDHCQLAKDLELSTLRISELEERLVSSERERELLEGRLHDVEVELDRNTQRFEIARLEDEDELEQRIAEVLSEIRATQRSREAALLYQIQHLEGSRDDAYNLMLNETSLPNNFSMVDQEGADDIAYHINRLEEAQSAREIVAIGDVILKRIAAVTKKKASIAGEELKVVIEERDSALNRCNRLQTELWNKGSALPSIDALRRERDLVVAQLRHLEQEVISMRAHNAIEKTDSSNERAKIEQLERLVIVLRRKLLDNAATDAKS